MEQVIQIKQCNIDSEHQVLDIAVEGTLPYPISGDRFRISAVFYDNRINRYFPLIAHGTVYENQYTQFHAAAKIRLDTVFFEYHPDNPDDIILLKFCTCSPDKQWLYLDTDLALDAVLFQTKTIQTGGVRHFWHTTFRIVKYVFCTLLLPVWLLCGYLAWKGYGRLHPAAQGRQGKRAALYHAHGLVMGWTGYGYSVREIKTNYFKKQYVKYCQRYPQTEGILFLSEREVERDGNLDLVRKALAAKGQTDAIEQVQEKGQDESVPSVSCGTLREFLVTRPVQHLTWRELRQLAELTARSKIIILEDFYPHLHALSMRAETKIVQLWHACGAFKLFGLSDLGIAAHLEQDTRNHRSYDVALTSGDGVVPFYSEAYGVPSSHIYPIGVPRTDLLFREEVASQKSEQLYQKYSMLREKRIVLFAPTFRGSGNQTAYYPRERFQIEQIMKELPKDVVLVIKNHPFVRERFEIPTAFSDRVLDLTGAENINDILFLTDVLVTDYSSVIFEAAILQIPMLFYVFDLEEYLADRDLYFDFAGFVPGEIVREISGLASEIQTCLESAGTCDPGESFREFFLGAIDGHSTERVVQLIEQLSVS